MSQSIQSTVVQNGVGLGTIIALVAVLLGTRIPAVSSEREKPFSAETRIQIVSCRGKVIGTTGPAKTELKPGDILSETTMLTLAPRSSLVLKLGRRGFISVRGDLEATDAVLEIHGNGFCELTLPQGHTVIDLTQESKTPLLFRLHLPTVTITAQGAAFEVKVLNTTVGNSVTRITCAAGAIALGDGDRASLVLKESMEVSYVMTTDFRSSGVLVRATPTLKPERASRDYLDGISVSLKAMADADRCFTGVGP